VSLAIAVTATASFADDGGNPFARSEKSIAAFEAQDTKSPPPKGAILFVGSSSIRMWKLSKSFQKLKTINRGFGGSQIVDSIHFADRIILKHEPRIVALYAGDNDIAHGKNAATVFADFKKFVNTVHAKLPRARIIFLPIKPSIARWKLIGEMRKANELIAKFCKSRERLVYVDTFTPMLGEDGKPRPELFLKDGLHMNAKGYKVWADVLKPHLRK